MRCVEMEGLNGCLMIMVISAVACCGGGVMLESLFETILYPYFYFNFLFLISGWEFVDC